MRSGLIHAITWVTMAILFLLLGGCGHKGPLRLPTPESQPPQAQTTSPPTPDPESPVSPSSQQSK